MTTNFNKKKEVLSQYNIDPYIYLDVDHGCFKEELDQIYKGRVTNTTNLNELKLLKECYKIILNDLQSGNQNNTRNQSQIPQLPSIRIDKNNNYMNPVERDFQRSNFNRPKDFHRTDFTDPRNRQALFVNNTLNFEEFQKNLSKVGSKSTDYSPNAEPVERLFVNQQFDIKQFNQHFENKYNTMDDTETDVNISPLDSSSGMAFMPICTYNGLIIEDHEPEVISFENKSLKKSNGGKKRKDFKDESVDKLFAQKAGEQINVDTSRSFKDVERIMEQEHLEKMKQQLEYNKQKVMRHLSIYPENIINDFTSNRLQDSSTCIQDNRLTVPKGIRKKE